MHNAHKFMHRKRNRYQNQVIYAINNSIPFNARCNMCNSLSCKFPLSSRGGRKCNSVCRANSQSENKNWLLTVTFDKSEGTDVWVA